MSHNIATLNALQRLINTYLEEQGHLTVLSHELETIIDHLRNRNKVQAVNLIKEATRTCEKVLFKLDLAYHQGTPTNDFTAWVTLNNVDMATSEVKVSYLGLKKAEDLAEFIELNLEYLAG